MIFNIFFFLHWLSITFLPLHFITTTCLSRFIQFRNNIIILKTESYMVYFTLYCTLYYYWYTYYITTWALRVAYYTNKGISWRNVCDWITAFSSLTSFPCRPGGHLSVSEQQEWGQYTVAFITRQKNTRLATKNILQLIITWSLIYHAPYNTWLKERKIESENIH